MNDARALLAELDGLREQRAVLAARIARLGRYSALRNELCRKQAAITRRVLEIEVRLLPRAELPSPPASPVPGHGDAAPDMPQAAAPIGAGEELGPDLFGAPYGGREPYWVRN